MKAGFPVGRLWDATGKWAIHFLLGPFLFWSLQPRPHPPPINTFCICSLVGYADGIPDLGACGPRKSLSPGSPGGQAQKAGCTSYFPELVSNCPLIKSPGSSSCTPNPYVSHGLGSD